MVKIAAFSQRGVEYIGTLSTAAAIRVVGLLARDPAGFHSFYLGMGPVLSGEFSADDAVARLTELLAR